MSYKFDSLIAILNKIDSGETVTVQSLINNGVNRDTSRITLRLEWFYK